MNSGGENDLGGAGESTKPRFPAVRIPVWIAFPRLARVCFDSSRVSVETRDEKRGESSCVVAVAARGVEKSGDVCSTVEETTRGNSRAIVAVLLLYSVLAVDFLSNLAVPRG